MMTIDEAIKHCEEIGLGCDKCADEHKQLAEWLKELKELKKSESLEVKEVDLDEEVKRFTMSKELYETKSVIRTVAKHFFELGMQVSNKAQKGEEL